MKCEKNPEKTPSEQIAQLVRINKLMGPHTTMARVWLYSAL